VFDGGDESASFVAVEVDAGDDDRDSDEGRGEGEPRLVLDCLEE